MTVRIGARAHRCRSALRRNRYKILLILLSLNASLSFLVHYCDCPSLDIEWLLSTLFDASCSNLLSRRYRRLFFCPVFDNSDARRRIRSSVLRRQPATLQNRVRQQLCLDLRGVAADITLTWRLGCAMWLSTPGWGKINKNVNKKNKTNVSSVEACDMEQLVNEAALVSRREFVNSQVFTDLFATAWPWSRKPRAISTAPAGRSQEARTGAPARPRHRKHAADHAADAAAPVVLHRAVKEGEMSLAQAQKEKVKVKLSGVENGEEQNINLLPERLRGLIERSRVLQTAVRRLDATMHPNADPARPRSANPVERQLGLLKAAFERE
jgi:regulator of CtrA degradation